MTAREGVSLGAVSQETYSIALTTVVVTIALTPFVTRLAPILYGRRRERFPGEPMMTFNLPDDGCRDYVVIAVHGRVGTFIARLLHRLDQSLWS